jgi:hypothetical protein
MHLFFRSSPEQFETGGNLLRDLPPRKLEDGTSGMERSGNIAFNQVLSRIGSQPLGCPAPDCRVLMGIFKNEAERRL